jgi:hypothetical protein
LESLVGATALEPAASCVTGVLNQLEAVQKGRSHSLNSLLRLFITFEFTVFHVGYPLNSLKAIALIADHRSALNFKPVQVIEAIGVPGGI